MKKYILRLLIGIVISFFLMIATFWTVLLYWEKHPETDCDACLENVTP